MLKTEEIYMEQNNKRMHEVTDPLYFVIDEKLNSVDLTDKGVDLISGNSADPTFFVLPDITAQLSELENEKDLSEESVWPRRMPCSPTMPSSRNAYIPSTSC